MDIESLAVTKVAAAIARCAHLQANISTNDKTPFTDGYIDLYDGLKRSKDQWTGRVQVQVKGRTSSKSGQTLTFGIPRTDLLAFEKSSGVLYFVVCIDPKSGARTTYYSLLSPFTIDALVRSKLETQADIPVQLSKFPNRPDDIESIIALAVKTQDQRPSVGFDRSLLDQAKSFTIYTARDFDAEKPLTLTSGTDEFALVLHTHDGLALPVGGMIKIFPPGWTRRRVATVIRSGEVAYDTAVMERLDESSLQIHLDGGVRLLMRTTEDERSSTLTFNAERSIPARIKAIRFCLNMVESGLLEIGEHQAPFEINQAIDGQELRAHLGALTALLELLTHLDIDPDLVDLDEIGDAQMRNLLFLHRAFVHGEEIVDADGEITRALQRVGRWSIMFLVMAGSAPDKWQLIDPFDPAVRRQFRWSADDDEADPILITPYETVEPEHLPGVLNMRLHSIVGAYEAIADFDTTYQVADERVLALIAAADDVTPQREALLHAAYELNEWLILSQGELTAHLINRWQILYRSGELTDDHRRAIRALKRRLARRLEPSADQAETCCALLLDDQVEADELAQDLPDDKRTRLESWPIWNLRTNSEAGPPPPSESPTTSPTGDD